MSVRHEPARIRPRRSPEAARSPGPVPL